MKLGGTDVETTTLGLGCADLFREPSRSGRRRLLDSALAAGIRHFDVAPMYGLGRVEPELARFARGRRDTIVIATKFGITPTPVARALAPVQAPLQRLAGSRGEGDPRAGAAGALLYRTAYGPAAARAGLERSLRKLGTDYVDLFFVHDPPAGLALSDELRAYLDGATAAGRIRAWGVAGPHARDVPVVQIPGDVFTRPPAESGLARIIFGVIGRALPRIRAALDAAETRRWSEATGVDCSSPDVLAGLLVRDAVADNASGPVLFSTTQTARVAAAAAAAAVPRGPDLDVFRSLLQELPR